MQNFRCPRGATPVSPSPAPCHVPALTTGFQPQSDCPACAVREHGMKEGEPASAICVGSGPSTCKSPRCDMTPRRHCRTRHKSGSCAWDRRRPPAALCAPAWYEDHSRRSGNPRRLKRGAGCDACCVRGPTPFVSSVGSRGRNHAFPETVTLHERRLYVYMCHCQGTVNRSTRTASPPPSPSRVDNDLDHARNLSPPGVVNSFIAALRRHSRKQTLSETGNHDQPGVGRVMMRAGTPMRPASPRRPLVTSHAEPGYWPKGPTCACPRAICTMDTYRALPHVTCRSEAAPCQ